MSSAAASEPVLGNSQPLVRWLLATLFTEMKLWKSAAHHSRFSGARVNYTLLEASPFILRTSSVGWCVS